MPIRTIATKMPVLFITAAMLLTGCGNTAPAATAHANAAAAAFVPPKDRSPFPVPGQKPDTPITAYVGKYPHDAVGGVMFFDRTDVSNALMTAVPDAGIRGHFGEVRGPEKAIFARGNKVGATGCDAQDCSGRNWTFLVDPAEGASEACYHDTATMGDSSRWFTNGAPFMRQGQCPTA
ncbi:MAG: lipoprotein [Sphingomonas bacterium]|uniref:hypothetical protein n=1 Tax=Sphingomonas bacterium TaxID=1895847 RepID=UPI002623A45C|nr:hypothetical protein [Sphingomonas bacterium]MDB5706795.1 lipoprotein [Sphingomonas bacterium]